MITLLRKIFIKNYKDVNNPVVREKHGIFAAIFGIFVNLLLFGFKLFIGLISKSLSIVSDAINNLTDLFSCLVNLFGFKMASKKPDRKHPFGHERIEYVAGMIISFIIVAASLILLYTSIMKLVNHEEVIKYSVWTFVVLGLAIVFKIFLGLFYHGIGKAINSVTLKASMFDSFSDVITTTVVLIVAVVQYFFTDLWWLDGSASILVALFILYGGIKMIIEIASPLIGLAPDSEFVKKIIADIKSNKGVLGTHDVVVHSYGPTRVFMTVHVEVDGYNDIFSSHDIIDQIEEKVKSKYGVELTVHMDPIDTKSTVLPQVRNEIASVLSKIDSNLSSHDVRIVKGDTHTNIVFDVCVPFETKLSDSNIISEIRQEMKKVDSRFNCVIRIDRSFVKKDD